jgi:hypothetical protein
VTILDAGFKALAFDSGPPLSCDEPATYERASDEHGRLAVSAAKLTRPLPGTREQRQRHGETERLRGLEVYNQIGCWTGRSAGFSPLRMRSTYPAARRYWSTTLGAPVGHQPAAGDE